MISKSALLAAAVVLLVGLAGLFTISVASDQFDLWKQQYQLEFPSEENQYRREIFRQTLQRIAKHNGGNHSYQLGLNQFATMTDQQFQRLYLSKLPQQTINQAREVVVPQADIDWQAKGVVSPVKNQGACDASYAFVAVGTIEGLYAITYKNTVEYSAQQIIDCSFGFGNNGCASGTINGSLSFVADRGILTANVYPYKGELQACGIYYGKVKIKSHIIQTGCTALANSLTKTPVAAMVSATNWKDYRSGIFTNCDQQVNANVLVTGMTDSYWRAKNSWGTSWGENGYIRISRSSDCGLCQQTLYPQF